MLAASAYLAISAAFRNFLKSIADGTRIRNSIFYHDGERESRGCALRMVESGAWGRGGMGPGRKRVAVPMGQVPATAKRVAGVNREDFEDIPCNVRG